MIFDIYSFVVVFLFILLDILTGVTQAVKNKTLSSNVMREGIYHKLGYVFILLTAMLCEYGMKFLDLGFTAPITIPCMVMISLTEVISILENITRITPEIADSEIFNLLSNNKLRRHDDEQEL